MASIRIEVALGAPALRVWQRVRNVGAAERLFPGVITAARVEGDTRVVTFASGRVARELIVAIDEEARRVAYAEVGGHAKHHHASLQVLPAGAERARLLWIADLVPDALAPPLRRVMEAAACAAQDVFAGFGA
jgi:hypothetical protein